MTSSTVLAQETQRVRERGEIEKKYLWATETIFPDVQKWEVEFAAVEKEVGNAAAFKGTLSQGPEQLLKFLTWRDQLEPRIDRVYVYASLLSDQDTRDSGNQGLKNRARSLAINYSAAVSWVDPELTALPHETIQSWMDKNQDLALYRQYFDNLFRLKKYILSAREEELIALGGEVFSTPYTAYNLLANADLTYPTIKDESGQPVELSDSAFYRFMRSTDRRVRKDAYDGIVSAYAGMRNTAASLLSGAVQSHLFQVKARGYPSCLAASLENGAIPVEVYQTLVNTVNENLPLVHRYTDIRKRALKLDDGVHDYDLYAPLVGDEGKLHYTYEQGVDTILTALQPLGGNYLSPMKKGFDSRWVDVFPTKGKRSGAYSSGTFLTQPYILLNFHGDFDDVSTLAHEMGHSMHSFFSRGTQPYIYADYSIFCAEVASTCNEILLQNYMLEHTTDPNQKLYLLVEFLEGFRGTVIRQTMFSEFEQRIHELAERGTPLTADTLGAEYGKIMKKYYGPSYTHDDLVDNYWIRIPHFYYNFYVYKYATSYCAATNIAERVLAGEPGAVDAYMEFLKAGSHKYPIDVLKLARVDMTKPDAIRAAMKHFEHMLDQTEALLKQVNK
ncbi:MAG TPA: oligoendopeptidase F [Phycisphaerae bacterium]|nr:oligoendopeptidase F [Phycisphaerae bacterium]HNU43690.1 oligoendopeptidase F [Phycisphaerae bacterium]